MGRDPTELVRINDKGEAHPIGNVASQRMRERAGAFRVLPSPKHVVFMRYTGEDGRRDAEDGAIVKLAGEITAPAALCDVIAMLGHTRWKGELVVLNDEGIRSIFMESGNVVAARTNVAEERLGEVMYRFGGITEAEQASIMELVQSGARFGAACVALDIMTEEQVFQYLGKQIEEIAHACMALGDGMFFFLDGFEGVLSHHTFSATMLLMDGVTRLDEIRYFRQRIPDGSWVPHRRDRQDPPPDELRAIYDAIDGSHSVLDLGRVTGLGEFETTKAVYALHQTKHVEVHSPPLTGGPTAVVEAANAALRSIHKRMDAAGKGSAFRQVLSDFAGAGVTAMLFYRAGPGDNGMLEAERVLENVGSVDGGDPTEFLKQKLHQYVSFALFSAGGALGHEAEAGLNVELEGPMAKLLPRG